MLIGRALQGVGIGVIPIGIATMRELLPPARLGPAISMMSSSLGVGGALGLPAAAALAQYGSWQWMFWGSAVMGLAIVALMIVKLRTIPAAKPDGSLDLIGALGLGVGLVALLAVPLLWVAGTADAHAFCGYLDGGLVVTTAGSVNPGSKLEGLRAVMYAIQQHGRYEPLD